MYIGEQVRFVNKAVDLLRKKIKVDYFFISAGFGLIKEYELLPPYECSFQNKTKEELLIMYQNLDINERLRKTLQEKYDVIYLVLSKDYLDSMGNLSILSDFGKEIILFQDYSNLLSGNFFHIDQSIIISDNFTRYVFQERIGGYLRVKGSILLNFAIDVINAPIITEELSFISWWNKKEFELRNLKENSRLSKCYSDEILE